MSFWIQASSPRFTGVLDPHDENLGEAVETAFPLHTECALMVWHHRYIPLSYKYDISVIILDLLPLLSRLLRSEAGDAAVQWPSNTFCARWRMEWKSEVLTIAADWTSVVGDSEENLNRLGPVCLKTQQFVSEWKQVLGLVLQAVRHSGYQQDRIVGMQELQQVYCEIPTAGLLYES